MTLARARRHRLAPLVLSLALLLAAFTACTDQAGATPTPSRTAEPSPTATVDPNDIVLTWTREGGIAGFCDGLTLTAGHQATLGTCEDLEPPGSVREFMPSEAIRDFEAWRDQLASFEVEWSDDEATADGMSIRVTFVGRGSSTADDDTQRAIADFAATLYRDLVDAQPRVYTPSARGPEPHGRIR